MMWQLWDRQAWEDYLWWQVHHGQVHKRVNGLLEDVVGNGTEGMSKPEPLQRDVARYWSRRITDEHRLAFEVVDCDSERRWRPTP